MPDQKQDWREKLMDQVDAREVETASRRRSIGLNFPTDLYELVQNAARERGISMAGFARRAAVAFAVHDLDLDWDEVMADEKPVQPYGVAEPGARANEGAGRGYGSWKIGSLP